METAKAILQFLTVFAIGMAFALVMAKIKILEDKIDTANEMLVQIRTTGIIGERVR